MSDWPVAEASIGQHNTGKRQKSMPLAGTELAVPAGARPQTHALDSEASRNGRIGTAAAAAAVDR
jgi:hypothetical protein